MAYPLWYMVGMKNVPEIGSPAIPGNVAFGKVSVALNIFGWEFEVCMLYFSLWLWFKHLLVISFDLPDNYDIDNIRNKSDRTEKQMIELSNVPWEGIWLVMYKSGLEIRTIN